MASRKKLLYICPALPVPYGNGGSIRAALLLDGAAREHDVYVLLPLLAHRDSLALAEPIPDFIAQRAVRVRRVALLQEGEPAIETLAHMRDSAQARDVIIALLRGRITSGQPAASAVDGAEIPFMCSLSYRPHVQHALDEFADVLFDAVLVMSIQLAPLAFGFLAADRRPTCVVDLIDVESTRHQRVSRLHAMNSAAVLAAMTADEARKLDAFERQHLLRFDRVFTCSTIDRDEVAARTGIAGVAVIPNGVPQRIAHSGTAAPPTDLLFVGTLGYLPNGDAVIFFCREILPLIRQQLGREPVLTVIGRDVPHQIRRLAEIPGVTVIEDVLDLAPYYAATKVAIVPLRAGGGTRTKILEAFSYGTPVVSTSIGAEGLNAVTGEHLLLADEPQELASACLRLIEDRSLASALAERARTLAAPHAFSTVAPLIARELAEASRFRVRDA